MYTMVVKLSSGTKFEYGISVLSENTSPLYMTMKDGYSVEVLTESRQNPGSNMLKEESLVTITHDKYECQKFRIKIKIHKLKGLSEKKTANFYVY